MAALADEYSRGWGHITTRQNIQFHFVQLERIPEVMRRARLGRAHHPRGLRRHRPQRAWAATSPAPAPTRSSTSRRGPRPPSSTSCATRIAQRLPRKFKINFSGCETDCGQAMFNDVGVVASRRDARRRHRRARLPGVRRRRPRRQPVPGARPRGLHPREELLRHARVHPAGLRPQRQPGQQAAGPHEVGRGQTSASTRCAAQVEKERKFLLASTTWPGGIPEDVQKYGDEPAGVAVDIQPTPIGQGTPVTLRSSDPYERWAEANVVRGAAKGTVSAYRLRQARRHHVRPVPGARLDPA